MRLSYRLAVGESRLDVELRLELLQPFFVRSRRNELFAAYNFSIQHARDQCFTELAGAQYCDSLVLKHAVPFISVGPTVRFLSVRRFAAFLLPAGPPTLPSQRES